MIRITREQEQFKGMHGWLETYHHFSFAEYFDPGRVSFGPLRVFNDDTIQPGTGFDLHQHNDMEIVTYVIEGTLEHKDCMGISGIIQPGEIQTMSAGTGVFHSEFNHSKEKPLRLLQIWLFSDTVGLRPSWEQRRYTREERRNRLLQVIGPRAAHGGVLGISQDAAFYVSSLGEGSEVKHRLQEGRIAYLFVIEGRVLLNETALHTRDAAAVEDERELDIMAQGDSEVILIDLPARYMKNSVPAEAV